MQKIFAIFLLGAVLTGCTKSKTTPIAPTPVTPTAVAVTISGLDALRTGFFSVYTANTLMSDGTSTSVTPTWSSSNPGAGSIDSTGRVDGNSHGSTQLTASYQGKSGSKSINVVQNFGGSWSGNYVLKACDQSGAFSSARWCSSLGGVGTVLPFGLALTQSGNGRDLPAGTLSLGSFVGNVSGNVTGDGRMVIGGTFSVASSGLTFTWTIGGWDTRSAPGDGMTGKWAQNLTAVGTSGNAYMESQILTANHTAAQVASVAAAPDGYTMLLPELFEMLHR